MFKIIKKSAKSKARLGEISTSHGKIKTPCFMPDATRAVLKHLSNQDLERLGIQSIVINTFHLYLQPGLKIIKENNSIHNFMNWQRPLLSDSGGYQVYSLIHKNNKLGKIYNDGAEFRSPLDGSRHELTPQKSIQIQFDLGTDMIVCLDDCPPNNNHKKIETAVKRTIEWAQECKQEYNQQIKKRKVLLH